MLIRHTLTASDDNPIARLNNEGQSRFHEEARAGVPSMSETQVNQLYILGLIFAQSHETELVLQSLGFGSPSDTITLVRCLEALFFLLQLSGT